MGVTYSTCDYCKETYYDGDGCCHEGRREDGNYCYRTWCSKDCAEADGATNWDDDEGYYCDCRYCRCEKFTDTQLLNYLLESSDMTRESITSDLRKSLGVE